MELFHAAPAFRNRDTSLSQIEQRAIARQQPINAANVNDAYANQFHPAFRQMYMDLLKLKDAEARFRALGK